jgi:AbrB family looped-hinge helix DNA binding protein
MSTRDTLLEFMTMTKIGEKGQLTVPKQFREDLGLGVGAPFAVLRLGDGLILVPEQRRFERLCERVSSRLTNAGLTPEDVLATVPSARERVYARRYGRSASAGSDHPTPDSIISGFERADGRNRLSVGIG